jgi:hypothetical protein
MKLKIRQIVIDRADQKCELCYGPLHQMSLHHRRPRGMGGSKVPWIHDPENLLALCGSGTTGCHGKVESYRERAYEFGWLVRYSMTPKDAPFADLHGNWWLLQGNTKISYETLTLNPSSIPSPVGSVDTTPREETDERPN